MDERDTGKRAEMPEHTREAGGGTAEVAGGVARQASTAQGDAANGGTSALLEDVLRRENLAKAYTRVVQNETRRRHASLGHPDGAGPIHSTGLASGAATDC